MSGKANPAAVSPADGAGDVDQAGKRVQRPYRSEMFTRKGLSLFDQLRRLEYDHRHFEHFYGKCPPGKGWWSPVDETLPNSGQDHHVRARPRRRRS